MKRIMMTVLLGAAFLFGTAAAASASPHVAAKADCYPGCSGGTGNSLGHKSTGTPTSATSPAGSGSSGGTVGHSPTVATATSLAFTGADVAATAGIAVLLVAGGIVLVRVTRRRQPAA